MISQILKYQFYLISLVSSEWAEWDSSKYCDYNAEVVGCATLTWSETYLEECLEYCHNIDISSLKPAGKTQCCDSEYWADGSANCVLYDTALQMPNEYENDGSGDEFASFTFQSCEYNGEFENSSCS